MIGFIFWNMASIWKHPMSRFWYACFTDKSGRQLKTSTKLPNTEKNRKMAQRIADDLEMAHRENQTATQIQRIYGKVMQDVTGQTLASSSVRGFLDGYLRTKRGEIKESSLKAYTGIVNSFLAWLGPKAEEEMRRIEKRHMLEYRGHVAETVSAGAANKHLLFLRIFFREAKRDGLIADSPCDDVRGLSLKDTTKRRAFTLEELRILIRDTAGSEWGSMVKFGYYTGARLRDLADLRWGSLDLVRGELRLKTGKTGRLVVLPLPKALRDHLLTLTPGEGPESFVHPVLATVKGSALSWQFGVVLAKCGLRDAWKRSAKSRGLDGPETQRQSNELTFHSLRHTAASALGNAGVAKSVSQDILGHESAAVNAAYTHIDNDTKRRALEMLPVI